MIKIITATRLSEKDFWNKSALAISLQRLEYDDRWIPRVAFENRQALSDIYNARILAEASDDILVFIHDDVWIDDYFFIDRIIEGLKVYDVLGVAGNRRRVAFQPCWAFANTSFTWDDKVNLTGAIAHGNNPFGGISFFGTAPADCELLDGVFLVAKREVLVSNGVFFDPQFDFHLYDMDFCRSARQHGLRLGTWPICLTHQSGGAFGTLHWKTKYEAYLKKWGS
jgi:GT2 family glycosyltransferase